MDYPVTLQNGTFEQLATKSTTLLKPYFVCFLSSKYRVFFYWSPLKCLSNFFELDPPNSVGGVQLKKNYLNILEGTSKKNTLYLFMPQ